MPRTRAKAAKAVRHPPTYDELDDRILALYTSYPKPTFNEIKRQIPRATQSRIVRAVWRSKREATMRHSKLHAVENRIAPDTLSDLRTMVQKFVQEVSAHPDTIQDMSVTITTPKGTVAVRWSQEVKPTGA